MRLSWDNMAGSLVTMQRRGLILIKTGVQRCGNCCLRNKRHSHGNCDDWFPVNIKGIGPQNKQVNERAICRPAVMATQTFLPEMQALPPGTIQTQQGNGNSNIANGNTVVTVVTVSQANQSQPPGGQQAQPQTPTRTQSSTSQPTSVVTVAQVPTSQQAQVSVVGVVSQQGSSQPPPPQAPQQPQQPPQQQPPQQSTQPQAPTIVQSTAQTQFITVPVSDNESSVQDTVSLQNAVQAVHSTYVQYVEGSTDPNIYATSNGQMSAYPVYCVSDTSTMYTPATAYYNTGNNTAVTYSQVSSVVGHATVGGNASMQGQLLTHQGASTYLVQGGTMDGESHTLQHAARASPQSVMQQEGGVTYLVQGSTMDGENPHLTPATRVSPATFPEGIEGQPFGMEVQWLLDNYETAEGVSLPRSTLYNHYLRHSSQHKLDPVNAASFGKLIRSVFLGLRTRRLGTRGNSKYHYYGIRVKPTSSLNQINEDVGTMALRQQPINQAKRFKSSSSVKVEQQADGTHSQGNQSHTSSSSSDSTSPQQPRHQQFLGDASGAIPHFNTEELDEFVLPEGIMVEDFNIFKTLYKEHCEAFLEAVINLQFSVVESLWQQFWRTTHTDPDLEEQLCTTKLYLLCSCEGVQKFVQRADYKFYQNLVEVLIPDVLRPIPSSLTQAIRNFAKNLEGWLTSSMVAAPNEMVKVKISAVSAFAQTLRRYTSLNHLAQAARAVLQNASQISQMLSDLNRVDFHNVQEQASWVCQCDDEMVQKLEQDFKLTLQQQNSLEQWADWLESVVNQVLLPHVGKPDFAKAARQFLLKWSFYSSMVIRDLTLRSAASFGSFHLIRLLYDEYMFYLIEHRVAQATGETPIAVMGEFIGYGHKANLRDISHNKPLVGLGTGELISITSAPTAVVTNGNHIISTGVLVNSLDQQDVASLHLGEVESSQVCGNKIVTVVGMNPYRRKPSQEQKVDSQMLE